MDIISQNINFLNTIEIDIWKNTLETDYLGAKSSFRLKDDYIKFLSSVSPVIRTTILEFNNWTNYRDVPEDLPDQFKIDVSILGVLKEFSSRLNKDIVLEYLKDSLEENDYLQIVQSCGEVKRLILALLLVENLNIELLQLLLLISRYERFGYQDYTLVMDLEGVGDPLRQAQLRAIEAQGITEPDINVELVNRVLSNFESNNATGLNSICLKAVFYNNEFVIFILRESQRSGLRTFEEFIVGLNADLIVLRFSQNLRDLKVRAVETVRENVYQSIANELVRSMDQTLTPQYLRSSLGNSEAVMNRFIQAVTNDEIPNISLYSLDIKNSPFPGRPNMSFQKTSAQISLSESLGYQGAEQDFRFSEIISQSEISKIKVSFLNNRKNHIFTFKIRNTENSSYVFVSGQGGGIRKRQLLIDCLNNETDIKILESKE